MGNRGFTLVETLVALVVLALGLLALAKLALNYTQANTFSQQFSAATVLANSKMEQLRSYATSERADGFSVFDFDYLTSTEPCFTTVIDPPGTTTQIGVSGLLSGGVAGTGGCAAVGAVVTTTGGAVFEVLYDDGINGADQTAGDQVWTGTEPPIDVTASGAGFEVVRTWTVEPLTVGGQLDFAKIGVETVWTDRRGLDHRVALNSMVYRRQ